MGTFFQPLADKGSTNTRGFQNAGCVTGKAEDMMLKKKMKMVPLDHRISLIAPNLWEKSTVCAASI